MLTAFAFPISESAQAASFPYPCTYTADPSGGSYYEDLSWDPADQSPSRDVFLQEGAGYCTGSPVTFELVLQSDGNLVIYNHTRALWASNTDIHNPTQAIMQTDGNFVIYSGGHALWATGTNGQSGGPYLCFQNDGNLVIYAGAFDCGGYPLWASGT